MKKTALKGWVRILLVITGLALASVIFIPIWRIELSAPQYPEGLMLQIYAGKLAGNVDIINGLNHYIGMRALHANDFIEFTVLPYLVAFFALFFIISAVVNKKSFVYILFFSFILFGIVAMVDFWRWEYNYGHNLNPDAAIVVPGMAYQPPLMGFKQLLNFGAYSVPDVGGWIFISAGIILFIVTVTQFKDARKVQPLKNLQRAGFVGMFAIIFYSCNSIPQRIIIGQDNCAYCNMAFTDARFGGEVVTAKGKVYKFDDVHCLLSFFKEQPAIATQTNTVYLVDFSGKHSLIPVTVAKLFYSAEIQTPMNGNVVAFADSVSLVQGASGLKGNSVSWAELINK